MREGARSWFPGVSFGFGFHFWRVLATRCGQREDAADAPVAGFGGGGDQSVATTRRRGLCWPARLPAQWPLRWRRVPVRRCFDSYTPRARALKSTEPEH